MFCNQPVPRFRREHQVNHWRHGLHIPHQILALVLAVLLAPSVLAEQEYYTWVDEFGRVHNTLVDPSAKKAPKNSPRINKKEFMSEQEFEQQSAKDRADNPEFYTWVDEQGRIRNQAVPQVDVTVDNDELLPQPQVTDHTLIAPVRLSIETQVAGCCQSYAAFFKETLAPFKSRVFSKPQFSQLFYTQSGNKPAWFFTLPSFKIDNPEKEPLLKLRLRDTDQPLAFIALNKELQPLYAFTSLQSQYSPATWRTVAMHETLISVVDEEVRAVIVYFPQGVENTDRKSVV